MIIKSGVGEFDKDGNLIKEYVCKFDVIKNVRMSDNTLNKIIDKDLPYSNNYYYKSLGMKLTILK